jgi:hypothetical protein
MRTDKYAEDDRHPTRGVPRPGQAVLPGFGSGGEGSPTLVVQYTRSPRYLCHALRQPYGGPVCQDMPTDPIDAAVVQAFWAALTPLAWDASSRALQAQRQSQEAVEHAPRQHLERLRSQVACAERPLHQGTPAKRLVAAALEMRGEMARREHQAAQDTDAKAQDTVPTGPGRSSHLQAALPAMGQQVPEV